jgi:hypothetical protein
VNSTETPGGAGIPAGWYDDPSGQGLRWWDGEQWTEHVHTAESAAAAGEAGEGEHEAPPAQLVKLRESIQARGAKGVGMVLGGLVLIIVVIALLLSGGSNDNSGKGAQPRNATPTAAQPVLRKQIKALRRRLNSANLPKAVKKQLEQQLKQLEKKAGGGSEGGNNGKSDKSGKQGKSGAGKASKEATPPGEEGN